jgi:hypothetical protein
MDAMHILSGAVGVGYVACAVLLRQLGRRADDTFLRSLSVACTLLALTQFANAVPGLLRGNVDWIYIPRLVGFLIIIHQIIKLKLAQ